MRSIFLVLLSVFFLAYIAHSQTTLSGNIGGMTFTPAGNPYLVTENIIVQEGTHTIIRAGTVFLFKPYTGMTIHGSLTVNGSPGKNVLFTSVNTDSTVSGSNDLPNPFDWNGIKISADAGTVKMSVFEISCSVYGIQSGKRDIVISDALFSKNGQVNFTVKGKIMPVSEWTPYSYSIALEASSAPFSVTVRKLAIPVLMGTTGIGFGGASLYFRHRKNDIHQGYAEATDQVVYNRIRDKESQALTRQMICAGTSSVFIASAVALYAFGVYREHHNVAIAVCPSTDGFSFSVSLLLP